VYFKFDPEPKTEKRIYHLENVEIGDGTLATERPSGESKTSSVKEGRFLQNPKRSYLQGERGNGRR